MRLPRWSRPMGLMSLNVGDHYDVVGHEFEVVRLDDGKLYFSREDGNCWPVTEENLSFLQRGIQL